MVVCRRSSIKCWMNTCVNNDKKNYLWVYILVGILSASSSSSPWCYFMIKCTLNEQGTQANTRTHDSRARLLTQNLYNLSFVYFILCFRSSVLGESNVKWTTQSLTLSYNRMNEASVCVCMCVPALVIDLWSRGLILIQSAEENSDFHYHIWMPRVSLVT